MNDGGAGWLVIILENSEASELSLPLPLALFSFSPLRGLFLICSSPFPDTHTDGSWWLADCSLSGAGEPEPQPAWGDNAPGEGFRSSPQRLALGGIAAKALILQFVVSNRGNIDWEPLIQKIKRKKPEPIINPLRTQHNKLYHFTSSLNRKVHRELKNGR